MSHTGPAISIDFEAAFDAIPGSYLILGPDAPQFTILAISAELLEVTGRDRASVIGKSVFDAYPENPQATTATGPSNLKKSLLHIVQHKVQDRLPIVRYDVKNAQGVYEERYWSTLNRPVLNKDGELLYIIHSTSEVTEQILAEKHRVQKKSDTTFQLLMQAPVGISILSGPENIVELANEQILKKWGRTTDIIGKPFFEVIPEAKSQGFAEMLDTVRKTGEPFHATEHPTVFMVDGKEKLLYYNIVCQPYYEKSSDKQPTGVFSVAHDVTELVLNRKNVEENEARLQAIIKATPECIKIVSEDGTLQFMNSCGLEMIEGEEVLLGSANVFDVIAPEDRIAWIRNHHRVCTGEKLNWEFDIIGLKGSRRSMETHAVTLPWSDGSAQLAVTRDVTERKKNEEDLRSKNEQLTQINNDLDNFIYTASHDLKAPISNIEGLLEVLTIELTENNPAIQETQYIMSLMKSSVDRFKKTITSLTDVVKLQQENNVADTLVSLQEIVYEVCLDLEPLIHESGGSIQVNIPSCHIIRFAEKNLRSVVLNLLSNAIKYRSPERPLQVSVQCHYTATHHVLSIADNGLGLSEPNQVNLFKMFTRFHDHVEGTGIGLYMIRKMVENAGGTIEVESRLGKGSIFRVLFKR